MHSAASRAGWDDPWWDESIYGFQSMTNAPTATNVWARKWVFKFSQSSTTNYIPEIDWTWGRGVSEAGYWFEKYVGGDPEDLPKPLNVDTLGVFSHDSHAGPLGAYTNGASRSWTNTIYQYYQPDTSPMTVTQHYPGVEWYDPNEMWSGNHYAVTFTNEHEFEGGGSTQTVTTVVTVQTFGETVSTALTFEDARKYDVYVALIRRLSVVYDDEYAFADDEDLARTLVDDAYKPFFFLPATRQVHDDGATYSDDLERLKALALFVINYDDAPTRYYIDPWLEGATNGYDDLWTTNHAAMDDYPDLQPIDVTSNLSLPTNVLTYTPDGGFWWGADTEYGRYVTNTVTVSCTSTGECTNTVTLFWGETTNVVGTNGYTTNIVSVNTNIEAGFTAADYGWRHLPRIITSAFTRVCCDNIAVSVGYTNRTSDPITDAEHAETWAAAQAAASNEWEDAGAFGSFPMDWPTETSPSYAHGSLGKREWDGGDDWYWAAWNGLTNRITVTGPAGYTPVVDLYVHTLQIEASNGQEVYANADGLLSNRYARAAHDQAVSVSGVTGTVAVTLGSLAQPAWCNAPTGTTSGAGYEYRYSSKGYRYTGNYRAVLKYTPADFGE